MRLLIYTDEHGYKRASYVKDTDGDNAGPLGIPAGPPPIEDIDWEALKREVNNILVTEGCFTWQDAQGSNTALSQAISVFKRHLVSLIRGGLS